MLLEIVYLSREFFVINISLKDCTGIFEEGVYFFVIKRSPMDLRIAEMLFLARFVQPAHLRS